MFCPAREGDCVQTECAAFGAVMNAVIEDKSILKSICDDDFDFDFDAISFPTIISFNVDKCSYFNTKEESKLLDDLNNSINVYRLNKFKQIFGDNNECPFKSIDSD